MNRIKELRKQIGMTQASLAKVLKVSDRTVGFYETGGRDPDTDTLIRLADFFDVSVDYLLGRSDVKDLNYKLKKESPTVVLDEKHEFIGKFPPEAKRDMKIFEEFIVYKYGLK